MVVQDTVALLVSTIANVLFFLVVALSALALDFFATNVFSEAPRIVGVSLKWLEYAILALNIAAFLMSQGIALFKFVRNAFVDREQSHEQ
ncbi:hypothetical protein [Bradyrhizobium diazoefficiens]|nr:hypothetical protein XF16B_57280 [Bradyrhizobium diazoefficiens]BCF71388.1 hypothetical protein XF19B_57410 [Bradyrhizobium diazoefficiens]